MRLTQLAQDLVRQRLSEGMIAVDATAGNGHDTLFLAQLVGPNGIVYAMDIQPASIHATRKRIESENCSQQVVLIEGSHAEWSSILPANQKKQIAAVMMNLGYLPGGDHSIKTEKETTKRAIQEAFAWLKPTGILTVLAYIGHPGGEAECDAVRETMLSHLSCSGLLHEQPSPPGTNGPTLFWCCCEADAGS